LNPRLENPFLDLLEHIFVRLDYSGAVLQSRAIKVFVFHPKFVIGLNDFGKGRKFLVLGSI